MRLVILLLPDMRAFEVASILEVFAGHPDTPALEGDAIRLVSPSGGEMELGHCFRIRTDPLLRVDPGETLIVPGFERVDGVIRSLDSGALDPVLDVIRRAHRAGAQIASACTGAFVLGAAGLLDDVLSTTHWMMSDLLVRRHPRIVLEPNVLYTHDADRRIWTSAGVTATIDLCLAMLAAERGFATAAASARGMVIPAARSGGQAQYVPARYGDHEVPDRLFRAMQSAVREDLARSWTTEDLARVAHMTTRTLQRRFREARGMSPMQWVIRERLASARELLESTSLSIEQVAHRVGFTSAELLRKHFHRVVGIAPGRYRESFGARSAPGESRARALR
ncbi:MAG: helix-turn-helix domain-containing protein [Microbacterium sp.]|jgi:transcriptional regulator GlxA family with amidase domain|uniref:GlxA family transcriptional regulator n=1 Tax=Microbacterium sp. TaxID=51671 RepID=UPI002829E24C|nr:helix-turn-helix domain-containing protein [Microbacterium sp.]MDR2322459.1 helix-turn-helix domain-containing protein [Microbacterium sp.]